MLCEKGEKGERGSAADPVDLCSRLCVSTTSATLRASYCNILKSHDLAKSDKSKSVKSGKADSF